ncbi:MAG: tautomerase family protein [Chthoniobacter sp.]
MPLVEFHVIAGRSPEEITTLLEASHRALLTALAIPRATATRSSTNIPPRTSSRGYRPGHPRTKDFVLIKITSRPRSETAKLKLYEELCRELQTSCRIAPATS